MTICAFVFLSILSVCLCDNLEADTYAATSAFTVLSPETGTRCRSSDALVRGARRLIEKIHNVLAFIENISQEERRERRERGATALSHARSRAFRLHSQQGTTTSD